ncbi:hypothetical protein PT015_13460 [Candidatus Mycobacterium wuenschmannii]|uniref:Uncharacterized protein n=1 Tax=Candidatus Mycobacterium wuenschmannii TaxID=3027808 RepID=A0ABY8VWQ8_9MYCO|nr:hypothetical protein [Candidatus Mycobacterium wuenschmannii]WIM85944.1 hypothetical protein PT015_13460 [Candidatus Mycobacterium wuenschmannii]
MTSDEKHFPDLTDAEKARWAAAHSDMQEMSSGLQDGTTTRDDIQGALNRLMSIDIDQQKLTNALHVPPDAGPYSAVLEQILRRIPDDWGRWISHDAGWYAIIATLDERLSALDSDYEVHQVKEKFGTLRYYCRPSDKASEEVWNAFESLVIEAERLSASTCECCAEPGLLHGTTYRVKTLCATCAETLRYEPK